MDSLSKVIILVLTSFAVLRVLSIYGVFEKSSGVSKLEKEISRRKTIDRDISFERWKLSLFESICGYFGQLVLPPNRYNNYVFYIERLEIKSELLERNLTPYELRGRELFWLLIGLLFIPLSFVKPIVLLGTILFMFNFFSSETIHKTKVQDEDDIIETNFIKLYLMLYPKLRKGSKARLEKTVEAYVKSLDISEDAEVSKVMKKFGLFFLNNLSMHEDHVAVPLLKTRYKSALIENFCNVATQSLQGIDNYDILVSTKIDLVRKKKAMTIRVAEKRAEAVSRAILLIYLNLVIFVVLSWVEKLPAGIF